MTNCIECRSFEGKVGFARNDLGNARGKLRRARPDDAPAMAERVREAVSRLRDEEANLAAHQAECTVPPAPRKILDVRRRAASKPGPKPRVVEIDREAMALALAVKPDPRIVGPGRNVLPATGSCHGCDRPVSGERRYCGTCLARRL